MDTDIEVWPTLYLAEAYWGKYATPGQRLLLCGVKNRREEEVYKRIRAKGGSVTIVEPFQRNAQRARELYRDARVLECTAQAFASRCQSGQERWPDLVLWLQGPEHAPKADALATLTFFRNHAKVIAEMPHGHHPQGPDEGNQHEIHQAHFYPHDFDSSAWKCVLSIDDRPKEALPDPNGVRHLLVVSK